MWYPLWLIALALSVYWAFRNALHLEAKEKQKN